MVKGVIIHPHHLHRAILTVNDIVNSSNLNISSNNSNNLSNSNSINIKGKYNSQLLMMKLKVKVIHPLTHQMSIGI